MANEYIAPANAPMQGLKFDKKHGGGSDRGFLGSMLGMGADFLTGNAPGPSERFKFHAGGAGVAPDFSSLVSKNFQPTYLPGMDPMLMQQLGAIRNQRINGAINNAALGLA